MEGGVRDWSGYLTRRIFFHTGLYFEIVRWEAPTQVQVGGDTVPRHLYYTVPGIEPYVYVRGRSAMCRVHAACSSSTGTRTLLALQVKNSVRSTFPSTPTVSTDGHAAMLVLPVRWYSAGTGHHSVLLVFRIHRKEKLWNRSKQSLLVLDDHS